MEPARCGDLSKQGKMSYVVVEPARYWDQSKQDERETVVYEILRLWLRTLNSQGLIKLLKSFIMILRDIHMGREVHMTC